MKIIIILLVVISGSIRGQDDLEDRYAFLVGNYELIGRRADSEKTYAGMMSIAYDGKQCTVTRTIGGKAISGTGDIRSAIHGEARVFHIAFTDGGKQFEATYLMHVDLDNYARLSGYVYTKDTRKPGLEALFISEE